jgi:hypothetical protein
VITEGFFTKDEVTSARRYDAEIMPGKGGRLELHFLTEEKYETWMKEQKELHPNLWVGSVRISKSST